jgi:hypothetical protein
MSQVYELSKISIEESLKKNDDDFDLKTKQSSLNLNFGDYFGFFLFIELFFPKIICIYFKC